MTETLRLSRGEYAARFDRLNADFADLKAKVASVERERLGLKLNTIAELEQNVPS